MRSGCSRKGNPGWFYRRFGLIVLYFAVERYAGRSGLLKVARGWMQTTSSPCSPIWLRAGWKAKQQPLLFPPDLVDHALWATQAPVRSGGGKNSITELRRKELLREREGYSEVV
jgi:hypothetical protein